MAREARAPSRVWVLVEHTGDAFMVTDNENEADDWRTNEDRIKAGQRVFEYAPTPKRSNG